MNRTDVLAEIATATADLIEARYTSHTAGPRLWGTIGRVLYDLYGTPAAAELARRAGVDQLQHWQASQPAAVQTLRDMAAEHAPLADLRALSAEHQVLAARQQLGEALGWPAEDSRQTLLGIARETARDVERLKGENERLRRENERLRQELRA